MHSRTNRFPTFVQVQGPPLDGGLKVDLDHFDPAFFERLRSRVLAARDRGIYVGIMLFSPDGAKREDWKSLGRNLYCVEGSACDVGAFEFTAIQRN